MDIAKLPSQRVRFHPKKMRLGAAGFPPGSIEAKVASLGRRIPLKEWNKLPADLTSNLDHYLYGIAKQR